MMIPDVLVVGAGPAGLAVAYHLRDSGLDVAVVEARSEVGGRTRTISLAGERVNTAAMWVYVGTESDRMCRDLGVETWRVHPPTYGVHFGGRTVIASEDRDLVQRLGLSPEAASELTQLLERVRAEYEAFARDGDLTQDSSALAELSFLDHVGELQPAVQAIVDNAVRAGSTARPEDLSVNRPGLLGGS